MVVCVAMDRGSGFEDMFVARLHVGTERQAILESDVQGTRMLPFDYNNHSLPSIPIKIGERHGRTHQHD